MSSSDPVDIVTNVIIAMILMGGPLTYLIFNILNAL